MELSADVLELLRKDDEFLLYRDKPSSVLLLAPISTRPALESLRKIEHEYSLARGLRIECCSLTRLMICVLPPLGEC